MSSVTVLCPSARRCVVKVGPGKLLHEVLEEACLKMGYDANGHHLIHRNKKVDLSLPFRLSGLPNNVTLNLEASSRAGDESAEIALHVGNERKSISFPVSSSLLHVLTTFSSKFGNDLLAVSSDSVPSCAFMNKTYVGQVELEATTLQSMGITSGRSLIRYQRLSMSTDKMTAIAERIEQEKAKKAALSADYATRCAENEERERLERERALRFEEERLKEEAENARRQLGANPEPMDMSESADFTRDRLPPPSRPDPNAWSFEQTPFSRAPVVVSENTSDSNPRLARLQNLLNSVDASLSGQSSAAADGLIDLLAERGRVSIAQLDSNNQANQFPLRNFKFPDTPTTMTTDQSDISYQGPSQTSNRILVEKPERKSLLFRKGEAPNAPGHEAVEGDHQKLQDVDDSFFDVNVDDVKKMQRSLSEQVKSEQQRALLPRAYIEARNRELKLAAWQHTVIRVVLPDRTTLQGNFLSSEPVNRIHEWFSSLMTNRQSFYLSLVLHVPLEASCEKNLVEAGVAPSSTVYAKFTDTAEDNDSLFDAKEFTTATEAEADMLSREWLSTNTIYTPWSATVEAEPRTAAVRRAADYPAGNEEPKRQPPQLPKWLKR